MRFWRYKLLEMAFGLVLFVLSLPVLFLAIGLFFILLQAQIYRVLGPFGLHGATPSLVLPLVIFLGVHEPSMPRGALLAFGLGYLLDLLGVAPLFLFTFVFVALWALARVAGVRLTAQTVLTRFSLGLVTGTGSVGLLFPPALPLFIFGTVLGLQQELTKKWMAQNAEWEWATERFVWAGIVPGLVLVGSLSLVVIAIATSAFELPSVVIWLVTFGAAGSCFCVSTILMFVSAMNFLNQNSYDLPNSLSASRIATVVPFGKRVFR